MNKRSQVKKYSRLIRLPEAVHVAVMGLSVETMEACSFHYRQAIRDYLARQAASMGKTVADLEAIGRQYWPPRKSGQKIVKRS